MKFKFIVFALIGVTSVASADKLAIYPNKGQSAEQQDKDKASCYQWAKKQVGYSPEDLVGQQQNQKPAVGGAAKGAALGAAGGAITGNAGTGAAVGAGVGGAARARKNRKEQQAGQAEQNDKLAAFQKSESVCLEGKGYSVK